MPCFTKVLCAFCHEDFICTGTPAERCCLSYSASMSVPVTKLRWNWEINKININAFLSIIVILFLSLVSSLNLKLNNLQLLLEKRELWMLYEVLKPCTPVSQSRCQRTAVLWNTAFIPKKERKIKESVEKFQEPILLGYLYTISVTLRIPQIN